MSAISERWRGGAVLERTKIDKSHNLLLLIPIFQFTNGLTPKYFKRFVIGSQATVSTSGNATTSSRFSSAPLVRNNAHLAAL